MFLNDDSTFNVDPFEPIRGMGRGGSSTRRLTTFGFSLGDLSDWVGPVTTFVGGLLEGDEDNSTSSTSTSTALVQPKTVSGNAVNNMDFQFDAEMVDAMKAWTTQLTEWSGQDRTFFDTYMGYQQELQTANSSMLDYIVANSNTALNQSMQDLMGSEFLKRSMESNIQAFGDQTSRFAADFAKQVKDIPSAKQRVGEAISGIEQQFGKAGAELKRQMGAKGMDVSEASLRDFAISKAAAKSGGAAIAKEAARQEKLSATSQATGVFSDLQTAQSNMLGTQQQNTQTAALLTPEIGGVKEQNSDAAGGVTDLTGSGSSVIQGTDTDTKEAEFTQAGINPTIFFDGTTGNTIDPVTGLPITQPPAVQPPDGFPGGDDFSGNDTSIGVIEQNRLDLSGDNNVNTGGVLPPDNSTTNNIIARENTQPTPSVNTPPDSGDTDNGGILGISNPGLAPNVSTEDALGVMNTAVKGFTGINVGSTIGGLSGMFGNANQAPEVTGNPTGRGGYNPHGFGQDAGSTGNASGTGGGPSGLGLGGIFGGYGGDDGLGDVGPGGSGGPCFPAGALISTPENGPVAIESVKAGDQVLSYNLDVKTVETCTVGSLRVVTSPEGYFSVLFKSGNTLQVTADHPMYTPDGWASIDPEITLNAKRYDRLKSVSKLDVGSSVQRINSGETAEFDEIVSIELVPGSLTTYTLENVRPCRNFFVEGYLASNRK